MPFASTAAAAVEADDMRLAAALPVVPLSLPLLALWTWNHLLPRIGPSLPWILICATLEAQTARSISLQKRSTLTLPMARALALFRRQASLKLSTRNREWESLAR